MQVNADADGDQGRYRPTPKSVIWKTFLDMGHETDHMTENARV